ncbi:MAG: PfkB family carbohydrate kinase [Anaerovoracaceae bacterium]
MKNILVIGSTVVDIIINVERLPRSKEDVHVLSQEMSMGGCAYNVSEMIRHFNVPYTLFSPVGTGIYGDFVRENFKAKGIVSPIPTPPQDNGCCYCFVENSGERTFVCNHGAEYLFEKEWLDNLDVSNISSIYVCGLELEEVTGKYVLGFLEEHSEIPVFFAPGPRINLIEKDLIRRIFALSPIVHLNDDEICQYTGLANIVDAAGALYRETNNTIVITNGGKGAYYFDGITLNHVNPCHTDKIIDTIGAGDSHIGALMANLYQGLSMEKSVEMSNWASSLVVQTKGALVSDKAFELARLSK